MTGTRPLTSDEERWLACVMRMGAAGKEAALPLYGTARGRTALGRGAGGDRTMEIDRACEAAMHRVLAEEAPYSYRLVSEESGTTGPEEAAWWVIVDPLDGSLNAKRGLEPFGASVAVAHGGTFADVTVGYIEDYTRPRGFAAVKGAGLLSVSPAGWAESSSAGRAGTPAGAASDTVEIVLLEAGRPDRHQFEYRELSSMGACGRSPEMRIRQIGSLALSLCYVAVGVADILVAAVRSRSVDLAAGLLILREAGGDAATFSGVDLWAQPLDLEKRCAFVAWRPGLDGYEVRARARQIGQKLLVNP